MPQCVPPDKEEFLDPFASVAPYYSSLAGILAGFAFAGLVTLVGVRLQAPKDESWPALSYAYAPLMAAFSALIASSLNYAVVIGDTDQAGRVAALETSAATGFAAAGILTFYSLLILLAAVEEDIKVKSRGRSQALLKITKDTVRIFELAVLLGIIPAVLLLFYAAIRDHIIVTKLSRGWHWLDTASAVGASLVVLVLVALLLRPKNRYRGNRWRLSLPIAGLLLAVGTVILSTAIIVGLTPCQSQPDWVPFLEVCAVTLLAVVAAVSTTAKNRVGV